MAVLLASLFMASALKASAAAAVTASKGVASRSFTRAGMPYCSLQGREGKVYMAECQNQSRCLPRSSPGGRGGGKVAEEKLFEASKTWLGIMMGPSIPIISRRGGVGWGTGFLRQV